MAVSTSIWLALRSRVESLPILPMPIAWPGSDYRPTHAAFLDVSMTAAMPARITIPTGPNERVGTLNIALSSLLDQDASVYQHMADQIASHFPEDLRLRDGEICLRITSAPHVAQGFRDGSWWRVPVVIPWRCVG